MKRLELYTATALKGADKELMNFAAASYREAAVMSEEWADNEGAILINLLKRNTDVIIPDEL